jgi:hypothetical protein
MKLLNVPQDRPTPIPERQRKAAQVAEWKKTYSIQTNAGGDNPEFKWMAVSMSECAYKIGQEYQLTKEQQDDLGALMEGFCQLVDERGFASYAATEFLACEALVKRLEAK